LLVMAFAVALSGCDNSVGGVGGDGVGFLGGDNGSSNGGGFFGGGNGGLDGVWESEGAVVVRISGSTGIFTQIPSSGMYRDAANKGYIAVGGQKFRNLAKTGNLEWKGESRVIIASSSGVATGANWRSTTITLAANGRTFYLYTPEATGGPSDTYTKR
jgi:hypothetical protein